MDTKTLTEAIIAKYASRLASNPDDAVVYKYRALDFKNKAYELFLDKGSEDKSIPFFELAIADYTRILEITPDDIGYYKLRGMAFAQIGEAYRLTHNYSSAIYEYDNAIKDYDHILQISPDAETYHNRGLAYFSLLEFDNALKDINEAIKLNSNKDRFYISRANVYSVMGQKEMARTDFEKVIEMNQDEKWVLIAKQRLEELGSS